MFEKFFTSGMEINDYLMRRRVILINTILLLAILIFFIFGAYNFFHENIITAIFDYIAGVICLFAIFHLRKHKDPKVAAYIATTNLLIFFLIFVSVNGSSHFGIIWTIFLPIFAILANGKKIGLYFSIVFYIPLFALAFYNIGIWENGDWLLQDFLRLFFSSLLLIYVMYMNEEAIENTNKKLSETHARELQYTEELRQLAITDSLTNLYNRRYFHEFAPKLATLAKRKNQTITFFILDIDYFKPYNDTYGHIAGDEALKKVATTLKHHIQRDDDFVFRLGGEEFAGMILSNDIEKTQQHISKLTELIEELQIENSASDVSKYITASIGISSTLEETLFDIDEIYSHSDKALYCAKESGRNLTKIYKEGLTRS